MATISGLFVKNRAETIVIITKTPPMILSKSRDLCFPAFAVVRPNAIQVVLVNSAVLGCLQLLLDPMQKFPHRLTGGSANSARHHVCQTRMKTQCFMNLRGSRTN
jgi:hypothetical protein